MVGLIGLMPLLFLAGRFTLELKVGCTWRYFKSCMRIRNKAQRINFAFSAMEV